MSLSALIESLKDTNDKLEANTQRIGEFLEVHEKTQPTIEEKKEKREADARLTGAIEALVKTLSGGGAQPNAAGGGAGAGFLAGALGGLGKGMGMGGGILVGLTSLGLGIGGFFAGLSAGDKLNQWIDADMNTLQTQMVGFGNALAATPTKGLLAMGALAAVGAKFGSLKGAFNMTLFGAGLGGFFAGLAMGDAGGAKLSELIGADGNSLASTMTALATGLNAFDDSSLIALGGLIGVSKILGPSSAIILPALGIGLGGFFAALAGIGDIASKLGVTGEGLVPLMTNLAEGLNPLSQLDGLNLLAVGGGLIAIGTGMAAILGAKWVESIGSFVGKLFGRSDEDDVFVGVAKSLSKLEDIQVNPEKMKGIGIAADIFSKLSGALKTLVDIDMDDIQDSLVDMAKTIEYMIPVLDTMYAGGTVGSGYFDGVPEMEFKPGIKDLPMQEITQNVNSIMTLSGGGSGAQIAQGTQMLAQTTSAAPVVVQDNSVKQGGTTVTNSSAMIMQSSVFDKFDSGTRMV